MNENPEVEILLVEDNPRDAELTQGVLREHHLANQLVFLRDGQEALDWLFCAGKHYGRNPTQRPKVILLDLKLPKVDGLEVLCAVRADPRTNMIPVVILTSSNEDRDLLESYRLGANSYIVKPVDFENFSTAVAQAGQYWLLINRAPAGCVTEASSQESNAHDHP